MPPHLLPLAGEGVRRTDEGNKANRLSSIVVFSKPYTNPKNNFYIKKANVMGRLG